MIPERPILPGCYPDPSVCRVGDDYYLVTSTFEYFPGLPVFHSTDLESWTQVGHAVDRLDQLDLSTVASSGGLYAPTIRHHAGTFYLTCTLVGGDGPTGNFVMTATDAAGPWSGPTWLEGDGFDPSLFFDDDRAWFVGTRPCAKPEWHDQAEVWLREFDPEALALVGEETALWTGAVRGAVWAEGPHLYRVGDWYYLLASEGGTEEHHAVSVARSRSVEGPYEGSRSNPVFTHRALGFGHPITGVGHPDLVDGPDGRWWAFLLASRPLGDYRALLGRETFAVAVDWEDDWPVFAPGVGQLAEVDGLRRLAGTVTISDPWTQVRTGRSAGFTEADTVTVRPGPGLGDGGTPAFLGRRQQHHRFTFGADLPEGAGIALRQSEAAHVLFSSAGLVTVRDAASVRVADVGPATRLEVRADGLDYAFFADDRHIATVDCSFLSTRSAYAAGAPSFLGVWIGIFSESAEDITATTVRYAARD